MDLTEFQRKAKATDQFSDEEEKVLHALLNLTESVGVLHRFIEQSHRDKSLPEEYAKDRLTQKLGDVLWYVANIASRKGIDLSTAATQNLERTAERWGRAKELRGKQFDDTLPVYERLPRTIRVAFFEPGTRERQRKIMIAVPTDGDEWIQIGDRIDDNAEQEDGYRFHDVLHLSNAAHLGWSPVIRALLRRKRKSNPEADRVEDGARAVNIEEALTAFVFAHASRLNFFAGVKNVDFSFLKTIERLTLGLEVRHRSYEDWEIAILDGYRMFRELREKQEGLVVVDLGAPREGRMTLLDLPQSVKNKLLGNSDAPALGP
jgi:NTP pyrophosphatase (non-canonical NTP hydrolase)